MLTDELQRGARANLGNGVEVIAAEKNAEIDELRIQC